MTDAQTQWIAFAASRRIAHGPAAQVLEEAKHFVDVQPQTPLYLFDASTSHRIDLDLTAPLPLLMRLVPRPAAPSPEPALSPEPASPLARSVGRPKLGVTAREVTLLPRHWEWLAAQPGGASVSLRKLVEHAMRANREQDGVRSARESAYRFISAMAGDEAGFEEATRALFAGNQALFETSIATWPHDVREHAMTLMKAADPDAGETPAVA